MRASVIGGALKVAAALTRGCDPEPVDLTYLAVGAAPEHRKLDPWQLSVDQSGDPCHSGVEGRDELGLFGYRAELQRLGDRHPLDGRDLPRAP